MLGDVGLKRNMIEILYSPPDELEISGTPSELQTIRQGLIALSTGSKTEIAEIANVSIDPTPYAIALLTFRAHVTKGPTKVTVIGNEVVTTGSAGSFEGFASFFDFPLNTEQLQHNHHVYFEGNEYVHQKSVPLVIGIRKERKANHASECTS